MFLLKVGVESRKTWTEAKYGTIFGLWSSTSLFRREPVLRPARGLLLIGGTSRQELGRKYRELTWSLGKNFKTGDEMIRGTFFFFCPGSATKTKRKSNV
jgi:hypothetical protein